MTRITAEHAQPGDVLLDAEGKTWQAGDSPDQWSTFDGPVFVFGTWDPADGPQGELTLLARNGQPARKTVEA